MPEDTVRHWRVAGTYGLVSIQFATTRQPEPAAALSLSSDAADTVTAGSWFIAVPDQNAVVTPPGGRAAACRAAVPPFSESDETLVIVSSGRDSRSPPSEFR